MALPSGAMVLFKYLPLSGIILALKVQHPGRHLQRLNGLKNFEYLFKTKDAWITRNTLGYNLLFIALDLVLAVTMYCPERAAPEK